MKRPYLLIGEAPNPATENRPELWLLPDRSGVRHAANRLLAYSGWDFNTFLKAFDRTNLLHTCPPRGPSGFDFPMEKAKAGAARLMPRRSNYRGFVLLGRRTASAFPNWEKPLGKAIKVDDVDYFQWAVAYAAELRVHAVIVPHPSGTNRWWNEPANVELAKKFFAKLRRNEPTW